VLDITKDIQSLTTFRRRSGDFMKQIKKSKRPVVLTVNGKAAAVVQDAGAYQRLLDIAASPDAEKRHSAGRRRRKETENPTSQGSGAAGEFRQAPQVVIARAQNQKPDQ
jgi:prevent-host-death family protein